MINDATSQYQNSSPTLTPIYIHGNELATLNKEEGRIAKYITLNSRSEQKTFLENCVLRDVRLTEGWEIIASKNDSPPAYQAPAEQKLSTANNLLNFPENNAVNSRSSEIRSLENGGSISTINHNLPSYERNSEVFATINHTPPVHQTHSEPKLLVTNTVSNSSKPVMVLERIASDFDARFSKSELMTKAQKATSELLEALAPESTADVSSAVHRFQNSMNEIFARIEKFQTSSLAAGVELNISNTIYKMAAQKFSGTDLRVQPACILKVRQALALANEHAAGTTGSLAGLACKHIMDQTLKIFQETLFENLKNRTKQITNDLLGAAEPGSKITITDASKVFIEKMTAISDHREHCKDHDLYNDFVASIEKASNTASTNIYYADEEKANMADWKAKSRKLAEENSAPVDEAYPKDILTPKNILAKQLRWMKEEDFSNQIKASIKEVFPKRYEWVATENSKTAQDIVDVTKLSIESLKKSLREKCIGKDEQEIVKYIQENRKGLMPLLMAGDSRKLKNKSKPNSITIAIDKYLESNESNLDVAISGMILDHLKDMHQRALLEYI